jgi:hypothetical protein
VNDRLLLFSSIHPEHPLPPPPPKKQIRETIRPNTPSRDNNTRHNSALGMCVNCMYWQNIYKVETTRQSFCLSAVPRYEELPARSFRSSCRNRCTRGYLMRGHISVIRCAKFCVVEQLQKWSWFSRSFGNTVTLELQKLFFFYVALYEATYSQFMSHQTII